MKDTQESSETTAAKIIFAYFGILDNVNEFAFSDGGDTIINNQSMGCDPIPGMRKFLYVRNKSKLINIGAEFDSLKIKNG